MAQDFATNMFDGDNVWSTDLQNIENALFTLNTMFSGTVAPANAVEGKPWRDTGKGVLKVYTGSAWVGLMHGDAAQKLWVYRNSALAGWVVDASVGDRVLAFKGGSTYLTGGAGAGTWTISGVSHTHGSGSFAGPSHSHGWQYTASVAGGTTYNFVPCYTPTTTSSGTGAVTGTSSSGGTHDGAWRPAAATGTLQYLNI